MTSDIVTFKKYVYLLQIVKLKQNENLVCLYFKIWQEHNTINIKSAM